MYTMHVCFPNTYHNLPISVLGADDKLIWHFDRLGKYTTESGYHKHLGGSSGSGGWGKVLLVEMVG